MSTSKVSDARVCEIDWASADFGADSSGHGAEPCLRREDFSGRTAERACEKSCHQHLARMRPVMGRA